MAAYDGGFGSSFASNPAGEITGSQRSPRPSNWWRGACCPLPKNLTSLSTFGSSVFPQWKILDTPLFGSPFCEHRVWLFGCQNVRWTFTDLVEMFSELKTGTSLLGNGVGVGGGGGTTVVTSGVWRTELIKYADCSSQLHLSWAGGHRHALEKCQLGAGRLDWTGLDASCIWFGPGGARRTDSIWQTSFSEANTAILLRREPERLLMADDWLHKEVPRIFIGGQDPVPPCVCLCDCRRPVVKVRGPGGSAPCSDLSPLQ